MTQRDKLAALRKSVEQQLIRSGKDPDAILFKSRRPHSGGDGLLYKSGLQRIGNVSRRVGELAERDMSFPSVLPPTKTGDRELDIASGAVKATQGEKLVAQAELRSRHQRNRSAL